MSRQPLQYASLGVGCIILLQCLGRLSFPSCMGLDGSSLLADSQLKTVYYSSGLLVIWCSFCLRPVNQMNSHNGLLCDSTSNIIMVIRIHHSVYHKMWPVATDIEMPFGVWTHEGPRNHALDGPRSLGEGAIWGGGNACLLYTSDAADE